MALLLSSQIGGRYHFRSSLQVASFRSLEFHTPLSYRYLTDDAKAVNGVTITLTVLSKLKTNFFGSAEKHPLFQAQLVHTKVFFVT